MNIIQPNVDIAAVAGSAPISVVPLSELEKAVDALAQRILENLEGKIPSDLNITPAEMVEQANKDMRNLYQWEYRICNEIREAIKFFELGKYSTARAFLLELSELNSDHYSKEKELILMLLIVFLLRDPITKDSSPGVVKMMEKFVQLLGLREYQKETIQMQQLMVQAFAYSIDLVLRHFAEKHINAITEGLKKQLEEVAANLEKLNVGLKGVQYFPLSMHIKMAIIASNRITGELKDEQKLFKISTLFGEVLKVFRELASSNYSDFLDKSKGRIEALNKAISVPDLGTNNKKVAWYSNLMDLIRNTWDAENDLNQLDILQAGLTQPKDLVNRGRIIAATLGRLQQIAIFGATPEIRLAAMQGRMIKNIQTKGILNYVNSSNHANFQRIMRISVIIYLNNISKYSSDLVVKKKARIGLLSALETEKNDEILEYLKTKCEIPEDGGKRDAWVGINPQQEAEKKSDKASAGPQQAEKPKPDAAIEALLRDNPEFRDPVKVWDQQKIPLQEQIARLKEIQQYAFGTDRWVRHFGTIVGEIPPLPAAIHQILNDPDLWDTPKKIKDTHVLVLVPKAVDVAEGSQIKRHSISLTTLGDIVKAPKGGGHSIQYSELKAGEHANAPTTDSHWVLMRKEIISDSSTKKFAEQQGLVQAYSKAAGVQYEVPHALDAAACCFLHFVSFGIRLFPTEGRNGRTHTSCQEQVGGMQVKVGGFTSEGLTVSYSVGPRPHRPQHIGIVAVRKF